MEVRLSHDTDQKYQCPTIDKLFNCPAVRNQSGFTCRECLSSWPANETIVAPTTKTDPGIIPTSGEQIYMMLLVPPFWGSSMLLNLISSSPAVSNMCKPGKKGHIPWQCESVAVLTNAGMLGYEERWDLNFTFNFSGYFDYYHQHEVWVDMKAPILIEKSPPYIVRVPELLDFYQSKRLNYRIVAMLRHPCRSEHNEFIQKFQQDLLNLVPPERRFLLDYDEITFRPERVVKGLLKWLPELQQVSLGSNNMNKWYGAKNPNGTRCEDEENTPKGRRMLYNQHSEEKQYHRKTMGMHMSSLVDYMFSDHCVVCMSPHEVDKEVMELWAKTKKVMDAQYT